MHLHGDLVGPTSPGCIKVSFLETAMIAFMLTLALLLMVSWRIPFAPGPGIWIYCPTVTEKIKIKIMPAQIFRESKSMRSVRR